MGVGRVPWYSNLPQGGSGSTPQAVQTQRGNQEHHSPAANPGSWHKGPTHTHTHTPFA